jgi:hypothetical protein
MRHANGTIGTTIEERCARAPLAATESTLCWPDLVFDRGLVESLGAPAQCWAAHGELWEFEDGVYFVTVPGERGRRRRIDNEDLVPDGPWHHGPDCACTACRVACSAS